MNSELPARDDRERYLAEMQAAADYIRTNVRGHLVPVIEVQPVVELHPYLKERKTDEDLPSDN